MPRNFRGIFILFKTINHIKLFINFYIDLLIKKHY